MNYLFNLCNFTSNEKEEKTVTFLMLLSYMINAKHLKLIREIYVTCYKPYIETKD